MKISLSQFLEAVDENSGKKLPTAGGTGKTFRIERTNHGVKVTPTSSGKPRRISHTQIDPYLGIYKETGLTSPSAYADLRDHSYIPTIFQIIIHQRTSEKKQKSAPPPGGAILLKWMDGQSRNFTDILPLQLFATKTPKGGAVHKTRGSDGKKYEAKCNVTIRGPVAELDYSPFATFNTKNGMLLGVARLRFADNDRTALQAVQWKPKGAAMFIDCPFETPKFEVPASSDYKPPKKHSKKRAQMVRERPGQAAFRRNLKFVYGIRCCITGCTVANALEGAHIDRYVGPGSNNLRNGLLLRSDVHSLFDNHIVAVDPTDYVVHVAPEARGKDDYGHLHGTKLTLPSDSSHHPDLGAVQRHWERFNALSQKK